MNLGVAADIVPVRQLEALEGRDDCLKHRTHLDMGLLECAVYAALQADYVPNRKPARGGVIETSYPAERFAAIATHLSQEYKQLCDKTDGLAWGECWEAVDTTCAKIFGYRVHEQIARDIENSEVMLKALRQTEIETLIGVSEDYLELRKAMCDRLEKTPARVVSTEYFARAGGADVHPIVVLASSQGELGEVPEGYTRLMAYDTSEEGGQTRPWRKWWWAAAAEGSKFALAPEGIKVRRPELFFPVIDSFAPTAKLMMNGRKIRTLIGPELMFAQQRALEIFGVTFRFFPGFEFPDDEIPEEVLRFFKVNGELVCDYSNEPIPCGEATILTPWAMRRYPDLARYTVEHLGGTDLAYHCFIRDWSHWAVSREMMEVLRPLMQRQLALRVEDEDIFHVAQPKGTQAPLSGPPETKEARSEQNRSFLGRLLNAFSRRRS